MNKSFIFTAIIDEYIIKLFFIFSYRENSDIFGSWFCWLILVTRIVRSNFWFCKSLRFRFVSIKIIFVKKYFFQLRKI